MKFCEVTFETPEENLACDEALLELAEDSGGTESLRIWEPDRHFVVLGYANRMASDVNRAFCQREGIPVLRRCTGGGTVLQGAGCLNYSLILRVGDSGPLHSISSTNNYILERHRAALARLVTEPVEKQGQSDLAIRGLKISGNAQRRKKHFLLFHGAFLIGLDISLVEKVLPLPSKRPEYRANRSHADFMLNLDLSPESLKAALWRAWEAAEPLGELPLDRIGDLVRKKYSLADWNFRF